MEAVAEKQDKKVSPQLVKKMVLIGLFFASVFVFLSVLFRFYKPIIVFSDSVDFNFAFVEKGNKDIKTGDYLAFVYSYKTGKMRLDIIEGKTLVKKAVCLPGDYLRTDVETRSFYCNGKFLVRAKKRFLNGSKAPLFYFDGKVPEGKYFVVGTHKDSFDSRYWGFVDRSEITGKVIPVF